MNTESTIAPGVLEEIVRRVVEAAEPERIVVFGSAARGEAGMGSDVDLLVVKASADPLEVARQPLRRGGGGGRRGREP